jgi:hypothetical protein
VENASATDIPSLEKRTAKLERAVVARAEELRRAALKSDFEPPPGETRIAGGRGGWRRRPCVARVGGAIRYSVPSGKKWISGTGIPEPQAAANQTPLRPICLWPWPWLRPSDLPCALVLAPDLHPCT